MCVYVYVGYDLTALLAYVYLYNYVCLTSLEVIKKKYLLLLVIHGDIREYLISCILRDSQVILSRIDLCGPIIS